MVKTVLKFLNDNHWYIIAVLLIVFAILWAYGCESKVESLLTPDKRVNRLQLENEFRYLSGQVECLKVSLDKQDAIKQQLIDAANVLGQGGSINPSGLLNLAASIGGISFGLSQRQKYNALKKANGTRAANGNPSNPS